MCEKENEQIALGELYDMLLATYGPQGWWPLLQKQEGEVCNYYHRGNYQYPVTDDERLEICVGAILTQNTSWKNVEKGMITLYQNNLLSLNALEKADEGLLKESIRSVGYFNQKTIYLRAWIDFLKKYSFAELRQLPLPNLRRLLLNVKGIGPETADCILLYALGKISFVVDAYTRRFLIALGLISEQSRYEEVKEIFERQLPRNLVMFQEYHALLVEHGKNYYSRKPYGVNDPLREKILQKFAIVESCQKYSKTE